MKLGHYSHLHTLLHHPHRLQTDSQEVRESRRPLVSRELALRRGAELPREDQDHQTLWVEVKIGEEPHHALRCDLLLVMGI